MRKDLEVGLVLALALEQACSPVVSRENKPAGGGIEPKDKVITPTGIPVSPTPEKSIYQIPTIEAFTPTPEKPVLPFLYFDQKRYAGESIKGGCSWGTEGCGIMVASMITRTDPLTYWYKDFLPFFANKHIDISVLITCAGTDIKNHREVLESMGYKFTEIPGSVNEMKPKIKEYTEKGIPVWFDTGIWNGDMWVPHYSMAVGVNDKNEIVFNDPYYGENLAMADAKLNPDSKAYAVEAPSAVEAPEEH